jgi:hypothetical protein
MGQDPRLVVYHLDGSILMGKTAIAMEVDPDHLPATIWGDRAHVVANREHLVLIQFDDLALAQAFGWWPVPRCYVTYYPD